MIKWIRTSRLSIKDSLSKELPRETASQTELQPLPSEEGTPNKGLRTFAWNQKPESGRDCLIYAVTVLYICGPVGRASRESGRGGGGRGCGLICAIFDCLICAIFDCLTCAIFARHGAYSDQYDWFYGEMRNSSEKGSYLKLIDFYITQL